MLSLQLRLVTYDVSVRPGHMVGGMIALGRGRLVSLETRTSFASALQHVRILKCFVILEAGCSLTVMTHR